MSMYDMRDVGKVIHDNDDIVRVFAGDTLVYSAATDYTTFTVGMNNNYSGFLNVLNIPNHEAVSEFYINDVAQQLPTGTTEDGAVKCIVKNGDKIKIRGHFSLKRSDIREIRDFSSTYNLVSCHDMFLDCGRLPFIDLSKFDSSNITDMNSMFHACRSLTTIDVSHFNTSNVTDMNDMFYNCNQLESLDVSNFDTSKVTDMTHMFHGCIKLKNLDVSNFDTSKVTDMSYMFTDCMELESLDVSNFNTARLAGFMNMFSNCKKLTNIDLSNFNLSNYSSSTLSCASVFEDCEALVTVNLSGWDQYIYKGKFKNGNLYRMFKNCKSLTNIIGIANWKFTNVSMLSTFENCESLVALDLSGFEAETISTAEYTFGGCINLSNVQWLTVTDPYNSKIYAQEMFYNCANITNIPYFVYRWYTEYIGYTFTSSRCFTGCTSLVTLGDTTYATNAEAMATIPVTWGGTKTE